MNSNTFDPSSYDHVAAQAQAQAQVLTQTANAARKRNRQTDQDADPKLIQKRAKAAERQRNKRERDRRKSMEVASVPVPQAAGPSNPTQPPVPGIDPAHLAALSKEEDDRREKVRAAARERQRKHRALVKQKKMAELGLAMGQDGVSGLEEMHYALGPDGQYQPVLPPNAHQPEMGNQDQPFPHGHGTQTGGQTFASTLLLSFSCSPLLKQHLLRTLHMTNEELCSLEPILSAAWDQWDHARRLHYAEQAAKANADQQNGSGQNTAPPPHPFGPPPNGDPNVQDPNDFRARFHRPLTAPSPFGASAGAQIDPSLGGAAPNHQGDRILAQVVQAAKAAAAAAAADADAEGGMDTDADISDKEDTDVSNVGENKAAS